MKISIQSLFAIIILMATSCNFTQQESKTSGLEKATPIRLYLELDDKVYSLDDEIKIKLTFENITSDQKILIKSRLTVSQLGGVIEDIIPIISDEQGSLVEYQNYGHPIPLSSSYFILLFPNSGYFIKEIPISNSYIISAPGFYNLYIIYRNVDDPGDGRTAWKGELISNTVQFRIRR